MKKTLLAALALLSLAGSAQAWDAKCIDGSNPTRPLKTVDLTQPTLIASSVDDSRASDGYMIKFCDDLYSWGGFGVNGEYTVFQYIPAEVATQLAGNKLTRIYFSCVVQSGNTVPGSVFVSEDIDADPVIVTEGNIRNCYVNQKASYTFMQLDEPYTIKEGQPFFFGFTAQCKDTDYPIPVDGQMANAFAGYIKLKVDGTEDMIGMPQLFGTNAAIYARTEGEKSTLSNVFSIGARCVVNGYTYPIYDYVDDISAWVPVFNYGDNDLTSLDYEYSFNGGESQSNTVQIDIKGKNAAYAVLPLDNAAAGKNTIDMYIPAINGVACLDVNNGTGTPYPVAYFYNADGKGYPRKFVVEEGTGTWCGWCPRGIVGMEYMAENYPDEFIGIAVHVGDSMQTDTYNDFSDAYFSSFPSAIVNRDPSMLIDPTWQGLEQIFGWFLDQPAPVKIELEGDYDTATKTANITATTTYSQSEKDADYRLAFVVLENGLIGVQENYYAQVYGTSDPEGVAGDWTNKGKTVRWTYSDTARDIFDAFGLEDSAPTNIEGDTEYKYTYPVSYAKVRKPGNMSIVVLALDAQNGIVVNAAKIEYSELSGISDAVINRDNATVHTADGTISIEGQYGMATVYNVAGQRVARIANGSAQVPAGIYVVNVDGKAHKVVVK